jgi:hypothetical protein
MNSSHFDFSVDPSMFLVNDTVPLESPEVMVIPAVTAVIGLCGALAVHHFLVTALIDPD